MLIKNAQVLIGKAFQTADIQFDRTITAVGRIDGPADLDAAGCYVVPGLVDIHTHGAVGEDFSDGKPEGLQPLADYYAAHGVTSYLATTMTTFCSRSSLFANSSPSSPVISIEGNT